MKKFITNTSIISLLLLTSLFATNTYAVCTKTALVVERVLSYGTYGFMYLRAKGALTNSEYFYARINSDKIMSVAGDAQTNRSEVNVSGNAATCPTAGTAKYMGIANYIYIIN